MRASCSVLIKNSANLDWAVSSNYNVNFLTKVHKEYITRRNKSRDSSGPLLISYRKPHGFVSKNTISRCIRTELKYCGVDTKLFKAHSTRSASTSKVATFAPISVVLAAGNWSNKSTFTRYYHKQIEE